MTQSSNQPCNIPRRRSTSDQHNHYVINITSTNNNNNSMNESEIITNENHHHTATQEQMDRSLSHFPSNTTFVIHSDNGTEFALIPANRNNYINSSSNSSSNNNDENNHTTLNESLLPSIQSYETINVGALSKHKRSLSLPFPNLFRSKSGVHTANPNVNTSSSHQPMEHHPNQLPNQISNFNENELGHIQQHPNIIIHDINPQSDNSNNNNNINNNNNNNSTELQHNDSLQQSDNEIPPIESSTSRFSFITRNPSHQRRRSLRSLLRPELSRPPTYKRYENPELEEQQERDMEALRRLQRHYNNDININQNTNGLLDQFFYIDESDRPGFKKALKNTLVNQFFGFYMAFWIVVFAFLGAVSVFIPELSPLAKLLWLPLILYIIGVCIVLFLRHRQNKAVLKLEEQVDAARRRRVNELLTGMELPNDHYFVIEQNPNDHTHPVMKLIPPPPTYSSPSTSTAASPTTITTNDQNNDDNGNLNLNHENHSMVHIDLVYNSISHSRSPSSVSSPSLVIRHQLSYPNLIQSSSNNEDSSLDIRRHLSHPNLIQSSNNNNESSL
ncbi:unnamed protein product [Cunninghamella blakesleeana]